MKNKSTLSGQRGFSLVELLVVIAVIGIIAAIAIPNIANITGNATYAKSQRNAQSICSVANAAIAAGYTNGWANRYDMVTNLSSGTPVLVTNANNPANVMSFSVSTLTPAEAVATTNFISFSGTGGNATINYVASGSAP